MSIDIGPSRLGASPRCAAEDVAKVRSLVAAKCRDDAGLVLDILGLDAVPPDDAEVTAGTVGWSPGRTALARRMRDQGATWQQIADALGMSRTTVAARLRMR